MISGMLWFDNDPKVDLPHKIEQAAKYYKKKYGQTPDTCFVHPKMLGEMNTIETPLDVKASESVLVHHLWIGVNKENH